MILGKNIASYDLGEAMLLAMILRETLLIANIKGALLLAMLLGNVKWKLTWVGGDAIICSFLLCEHFPLFS